jgi:hypothetical protein
MSTVSCNFLATATANATALSAEALINTVCTIGNALEMSDGTKSNVAVRQFSHPFLSKWCGWPVR